MILLEEEMRRVLESLKYEAEVWLARETTMQRSSHIGEGMRAYARRQKAIRTRILERFTDLFSRDLGTVLGKRTKRGEND